MSDKDNHFIADLELQLKRLLDDYVDVERQIIIKDRRIFNLMCALERKNDRIEELDKLIRDK